MIFCFVRETKQLTLEEIDRKFNLIKIRSQPLTPITEVFLVPTKTFISYELKTWLPYFIKRHIFRKDIVKPPPLIARAADEDQEI